MTEGRNRQIGRIISLLGSKVLDMQHIKIGNVPIGKLKEGERKIINNSYSTNFQ